jgi:putative ABC transport system permease protein
MGTILRALFRRPAAPLLLLLEVAVGMTIVLQSANVVAPVLASTRTSPGYALDGLWVVTRTSYDEADLPDAEARLAAAPGVRGAAGLGAPPFTLCAPWAALRAPGDGEPIPAWVLSGSPALGGVLGLAPIAGRLPVPGDPPSTIVVTAALAARLGSSPAEVVGRELENVPRHERLRVVGVVERLHIVSVYAPDRDEALLRVATPGDPGFARYLVRGDDVRAAAQTALGAGPRVHVEVEPARAYKDVVEVIPRTTSWVVLALSALCVGVVQVGVFAMASLLVAGRAREIGIRRALGATRGDILRYFLVENWLLMTGGIAAGLALTALTRDVVWAMPLPFALAPERVVPAALLFWSVGAMATLGPARRAARIAPVQATRGR